MFDNFVICVWSEEGGGAGGVTIGVGNRSVEDAAESHFETMVCNNNVPGHWGGVAHSWYLGNGVPEGCRWCTYERREASILDKCEWTISLAK